MSVTAKSPDPVDVWVGARVAARRNALGKNQSELGRALGLTFQQVQKYERGVNRISSSKLWAAAAARNATQRPNPKQTGLCAERRRFDAQPS